MESGYFLRIVLAKKTLMYLDLSTYNLEFFVNRKQCIIYTK